KYRVWEANRKVFLYPENWLRSELRDDKSPPFEEFQGECLQNDLSPDSVSKALRVYIDRVNDVSNLRVVGLYAENPRPREPDVNCDRLFVFGRTPPQPFRYYYRILDMMPGQPRKLWQPWREVAVEVPNCTSLDRRDSYVVPVVWRGRPLLFLPQFDQVSEQ